MPRHAWLVASRSAGGVTGPASDSTSSGKRGRVAVIRAIGLMSGTSLDGVDVALIETDGERIAALRADRLPRLCGRRARRCCARRWRRAPR